MVRKTPTQDETLEKAFDDVSVILGDTSSPLIQEDELLKKLRKMSRREMSRSRRAKTSRGTSRNRRTQDDIFEMREALSEIVEKNRPLTNRHLFYLAVTAKLIDKTEVAYNNVIIRLTGIMREEWLKQERDDIEPKGAVIPFGGEYIVDAGRWIQKPPTYTGMAQALLSTAENYRRDLWADQPVNVMIFCEKDAIADLVYQETSEWGVPLSVIRGDASKTFLWEIAESIDEVQKETYLYFLGDHDEKGELIIKSVMERVRRYTTFPSERIHYEKLAVIPAQIKSMRLPLRPSKPSKPGAAIPSRFARGSVEVDAIPPNQLRTIIREAIGQHVNKSALRVLQTAEQSEREILERITGNLEQVNDFVSMLPRDGE